MALAQRCTAAARTLARAVPPQHCAALLLETCTEPTAAPLVLLPAPLHHRASFCSSATLRRLPGDAAGHLPFTASAAAPATLLPAQLQARASLCSGAAVRELPPDDTGQLSFAARAGQQAVYLVDIVTGDVRGAGTEVRQLLSKCLCSLARPAGLCYARCFTDQPDRTEVWLLKYAGACNHTAYRL